MVSVHPICAGTGPAVFVREIRRNFRISYSSAIFQKKSTSTNSAITRSSTSSTPVNTMDSKSGLTGFKTIFAWSQESPSLTFSLSPKLSDLHGKKILPFELTLWYYIRKGRTTRIPQPQPTGWEAYTIKCTTKTTSFAQQRLSTSQRRSPNAGIQLTLHGETILRE